VRVDGYEFDVLRRLRVRQGMTLDAQIPVRTARAERLNAVLVPMGSAGIKAMAVVDGTVGAYVHDGGQHGWDSAAPVAASLAAALHASRLDGSSLVYNQDDPSITDFALCRPAIAARLLTAIAHLTGRTEA
jgi:3'(2'), 5'-bisphosphate nucleotidase